MTEYITAKEAMEQLRELIGSGKSVTQDVVEEKISKISVVDSTVAKDATTILYTGGALEPSNIDDLRYIARTEAAKFCESKELKQILIDLISEANNISYKERHIASALAEDYLFGVQKFENFKPTGIKSNGKTGPWANVSYRFAAETTGAVIVYIGDIDDAATRIWWNTEMPALLRESGVTSINSIKMNDLKYLYNSLDGSESVLGDICRLIDHVGPDGAKLNHLDNMNLYFDSTGKLVSIDIEPVIKNGDIFNWPYDTDAMYYTNYKDLSQLLKVVEHNVADVARVVVSSRGGVEGALNILERTGGSIDDTVNILGKVDGNVEDAIRIMDIPDADMTARYVDYEHYMIVEKFQAKQYHYERTQIFSMIDSDISSSGDFELKSIGELMEKYSFINEETGADIIREIQLAEYRDGKYGTNTAKNIAVYFDLDGNLTGARGQEYRIAEGYEGAIINSAFETTMEHISQYRNIDDISVEYGIKTELTKLEQIMLQDIDARYRSGSTTVLSDVDLVAKHSFLENCSQTDLNTYRAYEYLSSIGAGDSTISKLGIFTNADLKLKYAFLSDCNDPAILNKFRNFEYISANNISTTTADILADTNIYLDADGKLLAMLEASVTEIPDDYACKVTLGDASKFLLDDVMETTYPTYKDLSEVEKVRFKEYEYNTRCAKLHLDNISITDATMSKYLAAAGKTADQLNTVDMYFMKMADAITSGDVDTVKLISKLSDSCKGITKVAKVALPIIDAIGNIAVASISIYNAIKLYEAGYENEASAVMTGCAINVIGGIAGGAALTGAISPYLMGMGAVVGFKYSKVNHICWLSLVCLRKGKRNCK